MEKVTYSFLLPARNGMPFIRFAVESILKCKAADFELVVSDDYSEDGTFEYLQTVRDSRFRLVRPKMDLSMSEHWDWLSKLASGEWQMFIGQDDGLQTRWHEMLEPLRVFAESRNLKAITCKRAYFFWPGTEPHYGNQRVKYIGQNTISIRSSLRDLTASLRGYVDYFELPQMYTTTLFHHTLIERARSLLDGRLVVSHPQDASLAAVFPLFEDRYVRSELPFSWVGSSLKSAGLAVTASGTRSSKGLTELHADYRKKVEESQISLDTNLGDFDLGLASLYLWGAAEKLRKEFPLAPQGRFDTLPSVLSAIAGSLARRGNVLKDRGRAVLLWALLKHHGISLNTLVFRVALASLGRLGYRLARKTELVRTLRLTRGNTERRIVRLVVTATQGRVADMSQASDLLEPFLVKPLVN